MATRGIDTESKVQLEEYVKIVVSGLPAVLALVFEYLDLFQTWLGINQAQEISLTILIISATLWVTELVPLYVTSFVIILLQVVWLLPAINAIKAQGEQLSMDVFLSPFFSNIILLFLGGFVLSAILHKYNLDKRIAQWILKKTGSKPSRILLGIMLVSSLLSMWMSNTATAAMMLAIVLPILAYIPETNKFSKALVLSIPFACNLGGLGTPIGSPPNAIAMSFLAKSGIEITFAEWVLVSLPFLLILLIILWFLLLKLFPPGDLEIEIELEAREGLSYKHYMIIIVFLVTCIGWLTTEYHSVPTGIVSLLPIIICFGLHFLDTNDFRGLSWDILYMLGGGLTLGVGLQASGLSTAIVTMIPTGTEIVLIMFGILAALMTMFMSNTATANLLIPIAVSLEGQVSPLVVTVALMCSTSMALPVSTPPNAIAFGAGILKAKDMILPGVIITILAAAVVLFVGPNYWDLVGIFK